MKRHRIHCKWFSFYPQRHIPSAAWSGGKGRAYTSTVRRQLAGLLDGLPGKGCYVWKAVCIPGEKLCLTFPPWHASQGHFRPFLKFRITFPPNLVYC